MCACPRVTYLKVGEAGRAQWVKELAVKHGGRGALMATNCFLTISHIQLHACVYAECMNK